MTVDYAKHLRILDPNVGDDLVGRRISAIKDLAGRHRKQSALSAQLKLADSVVGAFTGAPPPDQVRLQVVAAVKKAAPSFVDDGADLEIGVILALSVGAAITTASDTSQRQMSFLATAVALGLSFCGSVDDQKLEALRADLLSVTREVVSSGSKRSRIRQSVPNPIDINNYLKAANLLSDNARLDREELDLLWWTINDWSVLADARISTAEPAISCLVSGVEAAGLLTELAARAHRDLALRNMAGSDQTRTAKELSEQTIPLREQVRRVLAHGLPFVEGHPSILPALAISASSLDAAHGGFPAEIDCNVSLTLVAWCRRIVDEASLLRELGHPIDLSLSAS